MENVHGKGLLGLLEIEEVPGRDLFMVAQCLDPMEAHTACGCLVAAGIPAVIADNNHVQAYQLLAPAVGGVRVLVPESFIQQAKEVLEALARGDFALGEDADVGPTDG